MCSVSLCVRGVVRVDVNIQDIDLDQCRLGDGWFAETHQCNRTTMEVKTPYWQSLLFPACGGCSDCSLRAERSHQLMGNVLDSVCFPLN